MATIAYSILCVKGGIEYITEEIKKTNVDSRREQLHSLKDFMQLIDFRLTAKESSAKYDMKALDKAITTW